MKRNSVFGVFIAALYVLILSGCGEVDDGAWRQHIKVTVTVDVKGHLYSGSSVQEMGCKQADPRFGFMSSGWCEFHGEAVPISLGPKGYLFMVFAAQNVMNSDAYIQSLHTAVDTSNRDSWEVARKTMPLLVTFEDINDSKTVKEVDPDHLDKVFGRGVKLVSVHAEKTQDPVTRGQLIKILPWLAKGADGSKPSDAVYGGTNMDGSWVTSKNTLANRLSYQNLITQE